MTEIFSTNLQSSLVKTDSAALAQAAATLGPIAEVKKATCKILQCLDKIIYLNLTSGRYFHKQQFNN